jgi:hypothetical protein
VGVLVWLDGMALASSEMKEFMSLPRNDFREQSLAKSASSPFRLSHVLYSTRSLHRFLEGNTF